MNSVRKTSILYIGLFLVIASTGCGAGLFDKRPGLDSKDLQFNVYVDRVQSNCGMIYTAEETTPWILSQIGDNVFSLYIVESELGLTGQIDENGELELGFSQELRSGMLIVYRIHLSNFDVEDLEGLGEILFIDATRNVSCAEEYKFYTTT